MKELYELKEKLCEELKKHGKKDLSAGSLDVVDKLSHTIKNLDKIIENYDDEYSNASMNYRGRSYRGNGRSYEGMSNARGRRRDSMGRYSNNYSYDEEMVAELRELMEEAPDERTKQEFKRFIQKIESM